VAAIRPGFASRLTDTGRGFCNGVECGWPPFNPLVMFKILLLRALNALSEKAAEFQAKDRLSFQCSYRDKLRAHRSLIAGQLRHLSSSAND
jgi:hypothetical protein